MGWFAGLSVLTIIFISLIIAFLWLIALIDILRSEFRGNEKIVWVLVVLFFPFLGALLYFLVGRSQRIRQR